MLWNIFGKPQVIEVQKAAAARDFKERIAELSAHNVEGRLQTLALANQAMWEILSQKCGVTEEDLVNKMTEIDQRDNKSEGKVSGNFEATCPNCNKRILGNHLKCVWCGAKVPMRSPF